MAKQTLPTNFKDDILDPSMSGKRKYRLIDNGDGTVSFEDVTTYTQTGSDYGAGQINATNQAVNESCDKANVIETMNDIMANQASGMIAGAKAVAELNGNLENILNIAFTNIYNSSLGTVDGTKIGRIAILKFSAIATNATIRTIRLGSEYAPARNAEVQLTKNGELLALSWFSRNTDTGSAELEYQAKSGIDQTYTGWLVYVTYS